MTRARNEYVSTMSEADRMENDEYEEAKPDVDAARKRLWAAAWRYVNQAKEYADAEMASDPDRANSLLTSAVSAISKIVPIWQQTSYFDKNTYKTAIHFPTTDDVYKELPASGDKRPLDFSEGSSLNLPPLAVRRQSTPNVTDQELQDGLLLGAEANDRAPATENLANAPRHEPEALRHPDVRIDFNPETPARSDFHSARNDDDDPMETSQVPLRVDNVPTNGVLTRAFDDAVHQAQFQQRNEQVAGAAAAAGNAVVVNPNLLGAAANDNAHGAAAAAGGHQPRDANRPSTNKEKTGS